MVFDFRFYWYFYWLASARSNSVCVYIFENELVAWDSCLRHDRKSTFQVLALSEIDEDDIIGLQEFLNKLKPEISDVVKFQLYFYFLNWKFSS